MNPQSPARIVAVTTVMAAAFLAAACSSSSPSSTTSAGAPNAGGATSTTAQLVAYTQCMRSHGVPAYPGPGSDGQMQKITSGQQVGVGDAQLNTARNACQSLWPYQALTPGQQRQQLADDLKFAQCMRSHGVPALPDPVAIDGRVEFVISVSRDGFDPHSPQILAKARACQHVLPAGTGLPSVTVTS